MSRWGYAPYVSVAQKKAKAEKKLKQLKKKMPHIRPVILQGNSLARSWWAKTWNNKLSLNWTHLEKISKMNCGIGTGVVKLHFKGEGPKGQNLGEYNMYLRFMVSPAPGSG